MEFSKPGLKCGIFFFFFESFPNSVSTPIVGSEVRERRHSESCRDTECNLATLLLSTVITFLLLHLPRSDNKPVTSNSH